MNFANQLTSLRILLMPLTFFLLFTDHPVLFFVGYILATLIGFTDYFDGYLARKYGMETRFGQFLDPLADKIFVVTFLLYFVGIRYVPAWLLIVIIVREFAMTEFRALAAQEKKDIRVNLLGKRKALFQYILLFDLGYIRTLDLFQIKLAGFDRLFIRGTLLFLIYLVAFFTLLSMFYYLQVNWKFLFGSSPAHTPSPESSSKK